MSGLNLLILLIQNDNVNNVSLSYWNINYTYDYQYVVSLTDIKSSYSHDDYMIKNYNELFIKLSNMYINM